MRFRPVARANATQVREFQNNRRCSLSIENEIGKISRFPRPAGCGEPHGEATDSRSYLVRAARLSDEPRYGENRGGGRLSEEEVLAKLQQALGAGGSE